jgi:hypothetical protein
MYTMNRCIFAYISKPRVSLVACLFWLLSIPILGLALLAAPMAQAQTAAAPEQLGVPGLRKFPQNVLRAQLKVTQAPEVLLDGKPARLSPGARIRDTDNRLLLSSNIAGQSFVINFLRNSLGEVHEVWILNEAEARQKIKPNTPERNFSFSSDNASASTRDDGRTPFNQLPTFEQLGRQQGAGAASSNGVPSQQR